MGLSVKQYADLTREWYPDTAHLSDDILARKYLKLYPEHRERFSKEEISELYTIGAGERGGDWKFTKFQFREMLSGMPETVVGMVGALTKNKDIIEYSEELRQKSKEETRERLKDPEIQGYLKWIEDEPISLKNFYQPQMMQRGLAQAAPSVATMIAVDVGLNLVTYGIGGTALRGARGGYAAFKAAKGTASLGKKAKATLKAGETAAQTTQRLTAETAVNVARGFNIGGTMGFMGALEASEQYNSTMDYLLEKGVSLEKANEVAAASAAIYGTLAGIEEYLPYGRFKKLLGVGSAKNKAYFTKKIADSLGAQGFWGGTKRITKNAVTQSMAELSQEYSQYMTQQLVNFYVKRGYEELPADALQYLKQMALEPEGVESAYGGGIVGLLMGGFAGGVQTRSSRVQQVMSEINEADPGIFEEEEGSLEDTPDIASVSSRVKLVSFMGGSTDDMSAEEQSQVEDLKTERNANPHKAAEEVAQIIKDEPGLIDELSSEDRLDLFDLVGEYVDELSSDDLEASFQRKQEKAETAPDEVVEEKAAIDETEEKVVQEEPQVQKQEGLDRVQIEYDDSTGELDVRLDGKDITKRVTAKEKDSILTAISQNEGMDNVKSSILSRIEEPKKEKKVKDQVKDESVTDEAKTQAEQEEEAITLPTKAEIEAKKKEEAVEAHDRAEHPEMFEDEEGSVLQKYEESITEDSSTLEEAQAYTNELYEEELKRNEITQEKVNEYAKRTYEANQERLKEYKKDPLKYLKKDLESWYAYEKSSGEKYPFNVNKVKDAIAELTGKPPVQKIPVTKPVTGTLQQRMTKKIKGAISKAAKKAGYLPKEQYKTRKATQFIGQGKPNSSTDRYRDMYNEEGLANTGRYTSDDIIFIASNGRRPGGFTPVIDGKLQGYYTLIDQVMEAGATIVMDTQEFLKTHPYNTGEISLAKYLEENGYEYIKKGMWKPSKKKPTKKKKTKTTSFKVLPAKAPKKRTKGGARVFVAGTVAKVRKLAKEGKGIDVLRRGKKVVEQFGNPFSHLTKSNAIVKTKNLEETIDLFDKWLRTGKVDKKLRPIQVKLLAKQRKWMLEQIDSGALDNEDLLYFQDTKDNHAKRLEKFINERRGEKKTKDELSKAKDEPSGEVTDEPTEDEEAAIQIGKKTSEKIDVRNKKAKPSGISKFGVQWFRGLYKNLSKRHEEFANTIKGTGQSIFGKIAAWYGPVDYAYSGQKHKMQEMPEEFQAIARNIEKQLGVEEGYFNSALANVYQEGDKLGAHADDEPIFVRENGTVGKVATVSIGGSTDITIVNNKTKKKEVRRVNDGDLYVMPGQTFQLEHKHSVGVTTGNRVSITFRHIPKNVLDAIPDDAPVPSKKGKKKDILELRKEQIDYTDGQKTALQKIRDFIDDKIVKNKSDSKGGLFVLAGYAGTGKTTIVENIVKYIQQVSDGNVIVGAPTNKAVLRLMDKAKGQYEPRGNFRTFHSVVYGAPDPITRKFKPKPDIKPGDVFIIDEASMINTTMWKHLQTHVLDKGARVILIGDTFQLPPVGGDPNLMAKHTELGTQLTEVVRQGFKSHILKLATSLRIVKRVFIPRESRGDVQIASSGEMFNQYINDVKKGIDSVVVVWSNPKRVDINVAVRKELYGKDAAPLIEGETLIAITNGRYRNGEIFKIQGIFGWKPITIKWKHKGVVQTPIKSYTFTDGTGNNMLIIPKYPEAGLYGDDILNIDDLPAGYKNEKFGGLDKDVDVVTYGYAITAHKSQGSEWEHVYIADRQTYYTDKVGQTRWLYTAVTRASKKLVLHEKLAQQVSWGGIEDKIAKDQPDDDTNEKLQQIQDGQKIDNNRELAAKVAKRLKKQFPFVTAEALNRVYDRHGREKAGRAIDNLVQWSLTMGTIDTIPHEYAHIYIDIFIDSPIVKYGIAKFKKDGDTTIDAEERLVQYIGEYYANKIQNPSLMKQVGMWLRKFWLNIKRHFTKLSKEESGDLLAEKFYSASMSKQTVNTRGKKHFQEIALGSSAWIKTYSFIDNGFIGLVNWHRKMGLLRGRLTDDKREHLIAQFLDNIIVGLPEIAKPVLETWLIAKEYGGNKENFKIEPFEGQAEFFNNFFGDIKEGIAEAGKDTDMQKLSKINAQFRKGFGIIISDIDMVSLTKSAERRNFGDWLGNKLYPMTGINRQSITDKQYSAAIMFYNSVDSSIITNQNNPKKNEKTFYILTKYFNEEREEERADIEIKKSEHKHTGDTNPKYIRKTIIEHAVTLDGIHWLSAKDIWSITKQGEVYNPSTGRFIQTPSKKDVLYDTLSKEQLVGLQVILRPLGLTIGFNRGDRGMYALVEVTDAHLESAKDPLAYWEAQELTKKQIDNFMGKQFDKKVNRIFHAEEIARYEALESIFINHMAIEGSTVMKRVKVPLTPAVPSDEMPDVVGRIFNKKKASFVSEDGTVVSAMIDVPGVGKKYRLDGSSLTSARVFKWFAKFIGTNKKSAKAKTVISAIGTVTEDGEPGNLFVKHQHFKPLHATKIYENYGKKNEKLVATIDVNGEIFDEKGEPIDILMTDDEAKIATGEYAQYLTNGESFLIPGISIGHVNTAFGRHDSSKHALQLYNYIHDAAIIRLFKETILPQVESKARKAFTFARSLRGKNAQIYLKEFFELMQNKEGGLDDSVFEFFKLGMGLHSYGRNLVDKLIQTQIVEDALSLAKMPGMLGDTIADMSGTLEYKEVGVPMSDASVIIQAYMLETGVGRKEVMMKDLNEWLKTADYQMLISRSPIPHIGGAAMVRVARVHDSNNVIEVHPILLFKDLEGDGDGDKVQLEKLPPDLEAEFIRLYEGMEVKGINLNDYTKNVKEYDISNREDLYELIAALTKGQKAIAEVSNVQGLFGIMQQVVNGLKVDGEEIRVRNSTDVITDPNSGIKGSVEKILRVYLQAATDNVEFLLLNEWDYSQNHLFQLLFVQSNGENITDEQFAALLPLIRKFKLPAYIRYGGDFNKGKYSFVDTIAKSREYLNFANSPSARRAWARENWQMRNNKVEVFFSDDTHVFEDIAMVVARLYSGYERLGESGSPYIFSGDLTLYTHQKTMVEMGKLMDEDLKGYFEEARKGVVYAKAMGLEFYRMFGKMQRDSESLVGWDTNPDMVKFAYEWQNEFRLLTDLEKKAATYTFLNGVQRETNTGLRQVHEIRYLPPVSNDNTKISLLDHTVLSKYFDIYNRILEETLDAGIKIKKGDMRTIGRRDVESILPKSPMDKRSEKDKC